MKDTRAMLDVQIETLMKSTNGTERTWYEDELRKRQQSRTLPFDTRNEVSADARYIAGRIITHLWVIIVMLPLAAAALYAMLSTIK
jgi:hypothetical protein